MRPLIGSLLIVAITGCGGMEEELDSPRARSGGDELPGPVEVLEVKPLLTSPHANRPYFLKGQMHTHSSRDCDGEWSSPQLGDLYHTYYGFDFVGVTDHGWCVNWGWDEWNGKSIMPSPDPLVPGLLHLPGLEDGYLQDHHLGVVGLDLTLAGTIDGQCTDGNKNGICDSDTDPCKNLQARLDYANALGAVSTMHHPVGSSHATDQRNRTGHTGIEIWNTNANTDASKWWDESLSHGHKSFGVCADDYEYKHQKINGGWILVNSSVSPATIRNTLKSTAGNPTLYYYYRNLYRQEVMKNIKAGNFFAVKHANATTWLKVPLTSQTDRGPQVTLTTSDTRVTVTIPEDSYAPSPGTPYFTVKPVLQPWAGATLYGLPAVPATLSAPGKWSATIDVKSYGVPHTYRYLRLEIYQTRHGHAYTIYSQPLYTRFEGVTIPDGSKDFTYQNREWLTTKACTAVTPCTVASGEEIGLFNTAERKWLKSGPASAGIQLAYTPLEGNRSIKLHRQPGSSLSGAITYGEPLALSVRRTDGSTMYLLHSHPSAGIDLWWSSTPVYEWTAFGGTSGAQLYYHQPFGLRNTHSHVNSALVYCKRNDGGISLSWRKDCSTPGKGRL